MRPISPAKVSNQKVGDTGCQPKGWRTLLSHIKKPTVGCGTLSGRSTLWSCWKWLFILVENQGSRRQWGILLLLPPCQTKQRIYWLFNSVSGLVLQLLPQEQIAGLELMTSITYLWVLLITLNGFATHLDLSESSHNFGQKITKPLVLIQITQTVWTYLLSLKKWRIALYHCPLVPDKFKATDWVQRSVALFCKCW